ncbi:MAG: glycosyltransferase family 4 protein [Ignavibacteriaceae bacterium]|jgi:glycosyltransferase involved in cell wall biosynthesis|nr:glycosyltransferase family 4 protein [Ignavibacteriaceae bacterium]
MKIVIISSWFSENMGYAENFLPRAMAKLGNDVHVITSTAQVYYNSPNYEKTYKEHLGPAIVPEGIKLIDGFTLHRLPFNEVKKSLLNPFGFFGIHLIGLDEYLKKLKPDIIQVFNIDEFSTYEAAKFVKNNDVKFFTESHVHASVLQVNGKYNFKTYLMKKANKFRPTIKLINEITSKCFPIAEDVADIAATFYRVPKEKMIIQSLGVNTDLFKPIESEVEKEERIKLRQKLGFHEDDVVSIYTGRFSPGKSPNVLAEAIQLLQSRDSSFKGLFIGNGTDEEKAQLSSKSGCVVHPFVTVNELPKFYRASDIGVWPREESTSQLDAAACGLPLILSDKIKVLERVKGNGLLFHEGDINDLADKISSLKDIQARKKMSMKSIENVVQNFSWDTIAKERIKDYSKK